MPVHEDDLAGEPVGVCECSVKLLVVLPHIDECVTIAGVAGGGREARAP